MKRERLVTFLFMPSMFQVRMLQAEASTELSVEWRKTDEWSSCTWWSWLSPGVGSPGSSPGLPAGRLSRLPGGVPRMLGMEGRWGSSWEPNREERRRPWSREK